MNLFRTPSLPPDTIHFAALALLWLLAAAFLMARAREPLTTLALLLLALSPFLLAALHVFWAINLFGQAYWGGLDAPAPVETVARLRHSLFTGSATSLALVLITAARACWVTWRTQTSQK